MIKSIILVFFISSLLGCKDISPIDINNYDLIDPNTDMRILVNYGEDIEIEVFTKAWEEIQICSGLSYWPAPYIIVVKEIKDYAGLYYNKYEYIELSYNSAKFSPTIIRHEMLHYLLDVNGLSFKHTNYLFTECVPYT